MIVRWIAGAALVGALAGCAPRYYPVEAPPSRADLGPIAGGVVGANIARGDPAGGSANGPLAECQADGRCTATPSRQQFYDPYAGRYYYYDQSRSRYYWENGEPVY